MRSLETTKTRTTWSTRTLVALAAVSLLATACKDDAKKGKEGPAPQAVAPALQGGGGAMGGGGAARAPQAALSASGEVLETMDASSYTYVRLKTADGEEVWVAGPKTKVAVGDKLVARNAMQMDGFESKSLDRKFDKILFAAALVKPGEGGGAMKGGPHGAMGGGMAGPHGGMGGGMGKGGANPHGGAMGGGGMGKAMGGGATKHMKVAEQEIPKLPKAEGEQGRTIEEVHAQASDLAGKKVAVRGVVVKFSPGIMGRNWVHIQDATGDAGKGTHDLTVTTKGSAKVGDRVKIEGTVAKDKDFGAGYKYDVIVEDAQVKTEL